MTNILKIAIPAPLTQIFDYLPVSNEALKPGVRVKVPFGRRTMVGILLEVGNESSYPMNKLRKIIEVLDPEPILSKEAIALARWMSDYYHHPIGEVMMLLLPTLLRKGTSASVSASRYFELTFPSDQDIESIQKKAPKQAKIIKLLQEFKEGASWEQLRMREISSPSLNALIKKGWVKETEKSKLCPVLPSTTTSLKLNDEQDQAVKSISQTLGSFEPYLLNGVTGSGKTEVYLQVIEQVLERNEQALVLVPEIGLTPQTLMRFQNRFSVPIVTLHSGMTDRERTNAWLWAQKGEASIIIGTRSSIFTPLPRLGIIIVDEEHDLSFKQQEGIRYSARDIAIVRGKAENVPVVLGTATPSLESFHNAKSERYKTLHLPERAGGAKQPTINILDVRNKHLEQGISQDLFDAIEKHLKDGGQVLIFLNRRGFAPILMCHSCGWTAACKRCDAKLTLHHKPRFLQCHHCGAHQPADKQCPECEEGECHAIGIGTERLEQLMKERFPEVPIVRVDRDSSRTKKALDENLEKIHSGHGRILIGTQMLAKGHHFPDVTLVSILNVDNGLHSSDFRATERIAQLIMQVSGRAGRAEKPGEVIIQTHHPEHPLLKQLVETGYSAFAETLLEDRHLATLPPHSYMALIRAEATNSTLPQAFLRELKAEAEKLIKDNVQILGPIPAPMEKRAGHFRAQLLLQSLNRASLHNALKPLVKRLNEDKSRKVRWSLDIDPLEMW